MSTWTAESDSCPISFSIDAKCDTYRIKMKLYAKSGVKINLYLASLDASQDNYIYLHLQNRKMILSTLCTSLDIEYLNENGIIMRERRIISKLHLFIDEYTSLLNKPYIEGEEKFLSSPLRSFDVAVSISTEACQTYAIHSFTGIGYRIFAHTQQLYDKSAQIHSKLDRSCTLETMKKLKYQSKWKHYFLHPIGMSKHFHTVLHGER